MEQRVLAFWAAYSSELALLLTILFIVIFSVVLVLERRRTAQELAHEVEDRVESELSELASEILRKGDEARQQLSALAGLQTRAREEMNRLLSQVTASKDEIDKLLAEVRSGCIEAARFAPTRSDLQWTSPEALLRLARQSDDWPTAAGYLARINRENATSRNLESAGNICRDYGFSAKAIEFYKFAAEQDPENISAQAELLGLSAASRSEDRAESLTKLQELVAQTLANGGDGAHTQKRFFDALNELGRLREMSEFCEAQLKEPITRPAQCSLHRHLAVLYQKMGRNEDSQTHCEAALRLCGDDDEVLKLYGRLLFGAKKYEEAYRIAIRTIQRDPTSARNYMALAEIQEKRMGRSAARDLLKKALQWADANEVCEIEGHLRRLTALDELSEILPSTQPQIIQA